MLKQLLRKMGSSDRLQTPDALARDLGVTPALVEDMIRRLAQQGYLTEASQCIDGCTACPLKVNCDLGHQQARFWKLTAKAERLLSD